MESDKQAGVHLRKYFAALPADSRRELKKLRGILRAAAPGAVDGFSYHMPAFVLNGKTLVWYAAWKQHISLYPIGAAIVRACASDVKKYKAVKSTIRFPLTDPPSAAVVKRLVRARIAEL